MSIDTCDFLNAMDQIDTGIRELMDILKEHEFPEVSNAVRHYYVEDGKLPFQVAQQFDRPDEFLQALLDMIRVQYEPFPMGSMLLNANVLAYLYAAINNEQLRFGYLSMLSENRQPFTDFWQSEVTAYSKKNGYSLSDAQAMFVVVTVGDSNYGLPLLTEVNEVLGSGISLKGAVKNVAAEVAGGDAAVTERFSGFCLDEAMMGRLRVSVWLLFD